MIKKILAVVVLCCALVAFLLFAPMLNRHDTCYVYVDADDNIDSVYSKMDTLVHGWSFVAFKGLASVLRYDAHVRTGRYALDGGTGALQMLRHMRNGQQAPVMLTIPSVRTLDRLAAEISKRLMMSGEELMTALEDEGICEKYGLDTLTIQCLFIPNTYDVYWNTSVEKFLDRMKKESDRFWTVERRAKAEAAGMTPSEVVTMASIVDEETANNAEKPMVAGMYVNRLKTGMPLQADPTIKYAWRKFDLKRIYNKLLFIESPYNTYRNTGLPPGPIRIPSVAGIDAVLNHVRHDYLYMCAKEDFSGTHNFAVTYAEHLKNAAKYTAALNARGIK
ncbi:MAG: endolytic transglycosylase MltG [Bacteroidales bacterium]|nr:endolytic transglycosylase MltG [Bacteroidales bacterium]MCM1147990.1 endolytic transglycosylase MltG [Bacteroidales bacterium]MCM1206914.1 endolytic transglycosylase MltG [Bacillota bacterium]MCM1509548.1 endolytic transglycosylase MltG [Clostridium sp.]